MNILCIGDIVGEPGREALQNLLPSIKNEFNIQFTVINGENAAGGAGITPKLAKEILQLGADVITLGDHTWDQKELEEYLKTSEQVIRPANFPEGVPGKGWVIRKTKSGVKVGVTTLLGRVFMRHQVECPFRKLKFIADEISKETPVIILDMHAEATSEKVAIGHYIDGQISAVFGTHTHIQTADEKILPRGTAYITDLGMTGPYDSVIGQNKESIINRFLSSMPIRFNVASDDVKFCAVVIDIDEKTGQAKQITRLQRPLIKK